MFETYWGILVSLFLGKFKDRAADEVHKKEELNQCFPNTHLMDNGQSLMDPHGTLSRYATDPADIRELLLKKSDHRMKTVFFFYRLRQMHAVRPLE